jgi:hypothetical protein
VLSVNVPVAVNCRVSPIATNGLAGVTVMELKAAEVTVRTVLPKTEPSVALIVVVPGATAATISRAPLRPTIAAAPVFEELQAAVLVRSAVELSL